MREWRYSSIHSSSRNEMEIWGSASLPSFFTPEGIAPATFRKWKCMWTSFPRKFFWNVTPCSLVGGYWSFRETWFSPILSWRRMLGHIIYWYRVLFIFFSLPFTIDLPLTGINVRLEHEPTLFYISVPVTNFLAARFFLFSFRMCSEAHRKLRNHGTLHGVAEL